MASARETLGDQEDDITKSLSVAVAAQLVQKIRALAKDVKSTPVVYKRTHDGLRVSSFDLKTAEIKSKIVMTVIPKDDLIVMTVDSPAINKRLQSRIDKSSQTVLVELLFTVCKKIFQPEDSLKSSRVQ